VADFELLASDTQLQARWNLSEEGTPRLALPLERVRSGLSQTKTQTKVNRCLTEGRAALSKLRPLPDVA
jgi:hypothetical protein